MKNRACAASLLALFVFLIGCSQSQSSEEEAMVRLEKEYAALKDQFYKKSVVAEQITPQSNLTNITDNDLGVDFLCLKTNQQAKNLRYTSHMPDVPGETGAFSEIRVVDCGYAYWIFESFMGRGNLYGPFANG